jgi:ABC-type sugar transport system substrate-binding protein
MIVMVALVAGVVGACASTRAEAPKSGKKDIVDTAVAAGQFKTLAAALKAAGLGDKVTIVGQGGGSQNFADLEAGAISALVPSDLYSYDYLMLDALARHWAGVPLIDAGPPYWLVKKDTAPEDTSKAFPVVEDYEAQWKKLWGKS